MTSRVNSVVEEVRNANETAADLVTLCLNSKKENLERRIHAKEQLYDKKRKLWSSKTLEEIQNEIQELKENIKETDRLLRCELTDSSYQRKNQMVKRQATSLIESNRIKRRKLSNQAMVSSPYSWEFVCSNVF